MDKLFLKILKNTKIITGLNYLPFLEDPPLHLKKAESLSLYKDLCFIRLTRSSKKKIHLVRPLDSKLNLKLEGKQISEMLNEFIEG